MRARLAAWILRGTRAKDILKVMDTWAENMGVCVETGDLWNIISAMRGPDELGMMDYKHWTTARVRSRTLPNLAGYWGNTNPDGRAIDTTNHNHFGAHVTDAARAIERQGL